MKLGLILMQWLFHPPGDIEAATPPDDTELGRLQRPTLSANNLLHLLIHQRHR